MIGACQLWTCATQSTGPRPPIIHDRAGRAATRWAVVIWSLVFYLSALGNVWTAWLAARRDGQPIVVWQVVSWELSSATAALMLLPAVGGGSAHAGRCMPMSGNDACQRM